MREATRNGQFKLVKLLLDNGAKPDHISLIYAIQRGITNVVKCFIDAGININVNNSYDMLENAICYNHSDVLKLLVDNGADIQIRDNALLAYASLYSKFDIIRVLLENGADVHSRDENALKWAYYNGDIKLVKLLLEHGSDPTNNRSKADNALKWSIAQNKPEVAKLLLKFWSLDEALRLCDEYNNHKLAETLKNHAIYNV